MNDVDELLQRAVAETKNLSEGEIFLVKDLFKGYEWNRIKRKNRLLLGTLFLSYVIHGKCCNIEAIDKTPSNQQKYRKR